MQHISESSLEHLPSRIDYLRSFIDFTSEDAAALHAAKPVVGPLVPTVVELTGYTGFAPTALTDLKQDHPQIKFRKDFLKAYLVKLVTLDYEKIESWEYLDRVGLMHTGRAGFSHRVSKPSLRVEYIHCAILLGYVEDILVNAVITHPDLDLDTKNAVARAVNKVVWIQNDLFARHYIDQAVASSNVDTITLKRPVALSIALGLLTLGALVAKLYARF
ncbi:hypothetical protein M413DRAFT_444288 [Hebeloma cylindrosporum]|uniref:Globin-sensor domain-containing protein n=1 Tax=Hebeloma cylindrosporum TaxID=76867 RepID=A0A0C3C117_HEBCY|nr:hypothetical protein M413DRAFT_444288 [Hebeloma cylindrosporum h7]